jgi:hypothetical protein
MPHKDLEARRKYRNEYRARRIAEDPSYRTRANDARNRQVTLSCAECGEATSGRKGKRFCSESCSTKSRWRAVPEGPTRQLGARPRSGEAWVNANGYRVLYCPEETDSPRGEILEHRLVMQRQLGRRLRPEEWVHHRNGVKTDNRPENLEVVTHATHKGEVVCPHCSGVFAVH